jgi:hypothetical protein
MVPPRSTGMVTLSQPLVRGTGTIVVPVTVGRSVAPEVKACAGALPIDKAWECS